MLTPSAAPLIIIKSGNLHGYPIDGSVATLVDVDNTGDGYYLITGDQAGYIIHPDINPRPYENATAIPDSVIDKLHAAFYDTNMTEEQLEAFQTFESYIY